MKLLKHMLAVEPAMYTTQDFSVWVWTFVYKRRYTNTKGHENT